MRSPIDITTMLLPQRIRNLRSRLGIAKLADFYSQFVRPGDLCFDVGANLGHRVRAFRRLESRVIAIEPHPYCVSKLQRYFGKDELVTIVPKGLSAGVGTASLKIGQAHTLSSMSPEWIERVRDSGRFDYHHWDQDVEVPVTTLDNLIDEYGLPAFCKVDVEGFEAEVFAGLTRSVPRLSFEFTPEYLQAAERSVSKLAELGEYRFNASLGETFQLSLETWVEASAILPMILDIDSKAAGDIYAIDHVHA